MSLWCDFEDPFHPSAPQFYRFNDEGTKQQLSCSFMLVTKVMLASEEKQHRRRCRPVHVWVQTRRRSKCPLESSFPRGLGKRPIRSHVLNTTDTDTLRLQGNALTPLQVPAPASGFLRLFSGSMLHGPFRFVLAPVSS